MKLMQIVKVYKLVSTAAGFNKQRVLLVANGNYSHLASRVDLTCLVWKVSPRLAFNEFSSNAFLAEQIYVMNNNRRQRSNV